MEGVRHLVIGDLHIGAERQFVHRGVRLYNTVEQMLKKIKALAGDFDTKSVIILGDVKDTVLYPDSIESGELKAFFDGLKGYDVLITSGNHDPHLNELVKCNIMDELVLGDFAFLHGHKWPSDKAMASKYIFAGHNHIAISLRDKNNAFYNQKAWLVAKFSRKTGFERYPEANPSVKLVVLPAFNDLIVGMPVNRADDRNLSPLFRNKIFNYGTAEVYSLRGDVLGQVSKIKKID